MEAGDVVVPIRGRDSGRLMFILGRDSDGLLRLSDGRLRRVETPKRKKPAHVQWLARPEGPLPDKIRTGEKISNSELRRALAAFRAAEDTDAEGGSVSCPKTT